MHFEDLSSPFSDRSSPKWQILAGDSQFQDFFVKLQHLVLSISVISGGFDAVVSGGLKGNGPWPCLILEPPSLHIGAKISNEYTRAITEPQIRISVLKSE